MNISPSVAGGIALFGILTVGSGCTALSLGDSRRCESEPFESPMDKLRRTWSGLQGLSTALESYKVDMNFYPISHCELQDHDGLLLCPVHELGEELWPYTRGLSGHDGWRSPYLYANTEAGEHYAMIATGSDRRVNDGEELRRLIETCFQAKLFAPPPRAIHSFADDLLWCDAQEILAPPDEMRICRE